jgi:uncharacterized protein with von Willebrand factor type A (vWA) domain
VFTGSNCFEKAADIVFLLDSSNSIWENDFRLQLDFVQNIVDAFEIGNNNIQVGVLTFSDKLRLDFHVGQHDNHKELKEAVRDIPYLGGGTDTGNAIKFARKYMFTDSVGARPWAAHIIIVITDGLSQNTVATSWEASMARSQEIKLFAIGVGQGVDTGELNGIGSDPDNRYVFRVNDYTALDSIRNNLAVRACERKCTQTICVSMLHLSF